MYLISTNVECNMFIFPDIILRNNPPIFSFSNYYYYSRLVVGEANELLLGDPFLFLEVATDDIFEVGVVEDES